MRSSRADTDQAVRLKFPIVSDRCATRMHHPSASMNWIRFDGSLRCRSQQYLSPLSGLPR
jgi:hypothetical protein